MSAPSSPYPNLQAESNRHRLNFIKIELSLCFTFSTAAARRYETGNQESADKSMDNAEKAYEAVIHFLSDPKHSKQLTFEETQETRAELEWLRGILDGLQRFRK
jgi:hypothetical protein